MADVALGEISERLGGELIGDAATRIAAIGPLESATPSMIAFLANPQYARQLASSLAGDFLGGREIPAPEIRISEIHYGEKTS